VQDEPTYPQKVTRFLTPARLVAAGLVLLGIAGVLYIVPSNRYIFLPDRARAVAPLVKVQGEKPDGDDGGIYYVAVDVRKASWLERLLPWLREGSTLVPESAVRSPGESDKAHRRAELRSMARSQEVAAAVALKALGYRVSVHSNGTTIAAVAPDGPSHGKVQPNDVIVTVDGAPSRSVAALRRLIRRHRPGEPVRLTIRRGREVHAVEVSTVADPNQRNEPIIGVLVDCLQEQSAEIKLPLSVRIDLGEVGGPSAGLAFALDITEELGHDVDRGQSVVATGELCLDGSVEPVGGIKQKTIGAERGGGEIFLVPAGDNATEAERYADGLRVVPVKSFRQALHALATIRRENKKT
jgi:PDZ domain-containing protein